MRPKWNDYYKVARMYLQNYSFYKSQAKRLEREVALARSEAGSMKLPGSIACAAGGEHSNETSAVERGVYRRLRLLDNAARLEENRILLLNRIDKIDEVLSRLDDEQREFLTLFHIENRRYSYISGKMHLCESWCKHKVAKATLAFCTAMFGDVASEPVCFLEPAAGDDEASTAIYRERSERRRKRKSRPEAPPAEQTSLSFA